MPVKRKKFAFIKKKNYLYYYLIILNILCLFYYFETLIQKNKIKLNRANEDPINTNKCYLSFENSKLRIIHLIITRFSIDFYNKEFSKIIYSKDYILNGIRVLKKYLLPSLDNQSCKNFIWILLLGNKIDITYVKSLFNFNNSFEYKVIYEKNFKNYVRNATKGFDIFISTRIDYDDRIYYDAVNDVRKAINFNRPMILYGYNRGFIYYEKDNKYYDFYKSYNNEGVMSVFISLIIVLSKVNDAYTIYSLGNHVYIRKKVLENHKSFGIKELNYDPSIFESKTPKYVFVRQKYSGTYLQTKAFQKRLKIVNNFNLNKFYGK